MASTRPPPPIPSPPPPPQVVALHGSGFLFFYYFGVLDALESRGAVVPGSSQFAGVSGGAVTAALSAAGLTGAEIATVLGAALKACAGDGCHPVAPWLAPMLTGALPDDLAERVKGRLAVWVTQLDASSPSPTNGAPWALSSFTSRDDIVNAVVASSYLPCWTGDEPFATLHGAPALDGGFSTDFAQMCGPESVEGGCVRVSAGVVGPNAAAPAAGSPPCLATAGPRIAPSHHPLYPVPPPSAWKLNNATCAAKDPRASPASWPPLVGHGAGGSRATIFPGFSPAAPLPFSACEWAGMSLTPAPQKWDAVFRQGVADGIAWAEANGFCAT